MLSGGGSNGAFEAGVVWGFMHYGNPADFKWDVVSGVSAGSINTAGIAPWAIGDELAMSEWLSELWSTATSSMVWALWPGHSLANGLFEEAGMLNDMPGY